MRLIWASQPLTARAGDQCARGSVWWWLGLLAGLSHTPGRCSRLSWAQLPPVSSLGRRVENKASLSALGSYQDLEVGGRGPQAPVLAQPGEGVRFVASYGGWGMGVAL